MAKLNEEQQRSLQPKTMVAMSEEYQNLIETNWTEITAMVGAIRKDRATLFAIKDRSAKLERLQLIKRSVDVLQSMLNRQVLLLDGSITTYQEGRVSLFDYFKGIRP